MTREECIALVTAEYGRAHDVCTAADAAGVLPRDIKATWPNVRGFMSRIPGPYHRPGPNGREDPPTMAELRAFLEALRFHRHRARRAMEKQPRADAWNAWRWLDDEGTQCVCVASEPTLAAAMDAARLLGAHQVQHGLDGRVEVVS